MIRHVVICQFRSDVPKTEIDAFLEAIARLRTPGLRSLTFGMDLGLRDGTSSYALVADFDDAAAYRRFDEDPEHRRIRSTLVAPMAISATRVQFALEDHEPPLGDFQ